MNLDASKICSLILHSLLSPNCQILVSVRTSDTKNPSFWSCSPAETGHFRGQGRGIAAICNIFRLLLMGISCRLASSVLLCPEDGDIALGFDEEQDLDAESERRNLCHFLQGKERFLPALVGGFYIAE